MSDNSFTPGTHPIVPPASQANPYAPPPQYQAPQQYPGAQSPGPQPHPAAQPYSGAQPYVQPRPASGLSVTSLVTGIAGIVLSWTFVMLLASIAAVITGHMALIQLRRSPTVGGRGMAIAGLILGYVGVAIIAFSVLIGIFSFFFIGGIGLLPFFLT